MVKLEKKFIFATLSIFFFAFNLFFASLGLTGHSISNSAKIDFHFFGIVSFILGFVFALIYFKPKNKKR